MNLDLIKQILDLVKAHDLAEFELEHDGIKIRVRKDMPPIWRSPGQAAVSTPPGPPLDAAVSPAPAPHVLSVQAPPPPLPTAVGEDAGMLELAMVTSPIVGTFYRAPEPSVPNFTEVGDTVKRGQVLCIIEAMKLMNEIESEYEGEVVKAFVENGQPVQYGERLFAIKVR